MLFLVLNGVRFETSRSLKVFFIKFSELLSVKLVLSHLDICSMILNCIISDILSVERLRSIVAAALTEGQVLLTSTHNTLHQILRGLLLFLLKVEDDTKANHNAHDEEDRDPNDHVSHFVVCAFHMFL